MVLSNFAVGLHSALFLRDILSAVDHLRIIGRLRYVPSSLVFIRQTLQNAQHPFLPILVDDLDIDSTTEDGFHAAFDGGIATTGAMGADLLDAPSFPSRDFG